MRLPGKFFSRCESIFCLITLSTAVNGYVQNAQTTTCQAFAHVDQDISSPKPLPIRLDSTVAAHSLLQSKQVHQQSTQRKSVSKPASPNDDGGSFCPYLTAGEEDEDIEECSDEGGSYDLENCECSGGGSGGGGGGSAPPASSVAISSDSGTYGQAIGSITAIVSVSGGGVDAPVPTGTVDFSTNAPKVEDQDVDLDDNGIAIWNLEELGVYPVIAPGSYDTFGEYSGDETYPSATGNNTLDINKAQTVSTVTNCPSGTVTSGQSITFKISVTPSPASASPEVVSPTGQVILNYSSGTGDTGTLSQGVGGYASAATISITVTGTGTQTVHGNYQGDTNYEPATGEYCSITVN